MSIIGEYLEGKFVVIRKSALAERFQEPKWQVVYATGGFGCSPKAIGTAVFVRFYDGDEARFERRQIERLASETEIASFNLLTEMHKGSAWEPITGPYYDHDQQQWVCQVGDRLRATAQHGGWRVGDVVHITELPHSRGGSYQAVRVGIYGTYTVGLRAVEWEPIDNTSREEGNMQVQTAATSTVDASEAHRADMAKVSARLAAEARDRGWCGDYDRVIESLNRELTVPLTARETEHVVRLNLRARFTTSGVTTVEDFQRRFGHLLNGQCIEADGVCFTITSAEVNDVRHA